MATPTPNTVHYGHQTFHHHVALIVLRKENRKDKQQRRGASLSKNMRWNLSGRYGLLFLVRDMYTSKPKLFHLLTDEINGVPQHVGLCQAFSNPPQDGHRHGVLARHSQSTTPGTQVQWKKKVGALEHFRKSIHNHSFFGSQGGVVDPILR